MAQSQIPGRGFIDETGTDESQIPGVGFIEEGELSVVTADGDLDESSDTLSATATASSSVVVDPTVPVTEEDIFRWLRSDPYDQVVLLEVDYQVESSDIPVTETLRISDAGYYDRTNLLHYKAGLLSVPDYSRSVSDDLGSYNSSLGSAVVDNANGEFEYILNLALDGGEARCKIGAKTWTIDQFITLYIATAVRASAGPEEKIQIEIQDTGFLLNKSLGGQLLIGGTGPKADKARRLNMGYCHQVECDVIDELTNLYSHSDTGDNVVAVDVREGGISVTYTENNDGTMTLAVTPTGTITADILALPSGESDTNRRLVSDVIREIVGVRAGLIADSKYSGPGPTFQVQDADDYPLGISIDDQQSITSDILPAITFSGNCFWAIDRNNQFTFGRFRPYDIASLGLTPVELTSEDIDAEAKINISHAQPKYYRLQATMSKNWHIPNDLSIILTPEQLAGFTRVGLPLKQNAAVGTTYADKPEDYHKSLVESPTLDTLISAGYAGEDELTWLGEWMEVRRFNGLPWIETVKITTFLEYYDLELGDVVSLEIDDADGLNRFETDGGALFQVIGINIRATDGRIDLSLIRRRLATPYPLGWERVTTEDDTVAPSFEFPDGLTTALPTVQPPVAIIDPIPPLVPALLPPGVINLIHQPGDSGPVDDCVITIPRTYSRQHQAVPNNLPSSGQNSYRTAITSDGLYAVVGVPYYDDGNISNVNFGGVYVYKNVSGTWTQIALLTDFANASVSSFGWSVGISDNKRIVVSGQGGTHFAVFEEDDITPDTWPSIQRFSHADTVHNVTIDRAGRAVSTHTSGSTSIHMWMRDGGGIWSEQQVLTGSNTLGYFSAKLGGRESDPWTLLASFEMNTPHNIGLEVWTSNDLITWSLRQTINTGKAVATGPLQASSLSLTADADASVLGVGAPAWDNGIGGAVLVYSGSWPFGYSLQATVIYSGSGSTASDAVGIGTGLSDNGKFLVFSTYGPDAASDSQGEVFYIENLDTKSGTVDADSDSDVKQIANPYTDPFAQFGVAIATDKCGHYVTVCSGYASSDTPTDNFDIYSAP